jgi:hypothetical protein
VTERREVAPAARAPSSAAAPARNMAVIVIKRVNITRTPLDPLCAPARNRTVAGKRQAL